MSNIEFIMDTADEFGLDVNVKSKEMDEKAKRVYRIYTRENGHKYSFEMVSNLGEEISKNELRVRELQHSLREMKEEME